VSSRESLPNACVLVTESCVVALETKCGRATVMEWEEVGREVNVETPSCGRGGSGGGVPSRDGDETWLCEGLRGAWPIMLNVGLAKSCCSAPSAFFGASSIVGEVGESGELGEAGLSGASPVDAWLCGPAFPVSDIEVAVLHCHEV
jgi:hypothetical protein